MVEHDSIDVDPKSNLSQMLLSYAMENGYETMVRLLVEHNSIDMNSKSY